MNKIIQHLIPFSSISLSTSNTFPIVINRMKKVISQQSSIDHPYKGIIKGDSLKFSKRDITNSLKSELVFKGKIIKTTNGASIILSSRYKIAALIAYFILITLFILIGRPHNHPVQLALPFLPYLVMVIRMKQQSKKVFSHVSKLINKKSSSVSSPSDH